MLKGGMWYGNKKKKSRVMGIWSLYLWIWGKQYIIFKLDRIKFEQKLEGCEEDSSASIWGNNVCSMEHSHEPRLNLSVCWVLSSAEGEYGRGRKAEQIRRWGQRGNEGEHQWRSWKPVQGFWLYHKGNEELSWCWAKHPPSRHLFLFSSDPKAYLSSTVLHIYYSLKMAHILHNTFLT